eukprot:784679-Prorocentrum_minimum.AAC.1
MGGTNVRNASYQRCEHPGFPGTSSLCKWRRSGGGQEGVRRGSEGYLGLRRSLLLPLPGRSPGAVGDPCTDITPLLRPFPTEEFNSKK